MIRLNTTIRLLAVSAIATSLISAAMAADDAQKDSGSRIGVVSTERIFKESALAKASQAKLQSEFAKREKELRDEAQKIKKVL